MLPERKQILVVDDEPNLRRVLSAQLERDGYDVHTAEDGEQALQILKEHHLDLVITDLRMPKVDGMELLRRALELDDELPVVMITAHGTVDNAVEALKTGAFDYLTKPFDQAEVRAIVRKALRTRDLSAAEATRPESDAREVARYGIIGASPSILELYAVLDRVADTPTTVLITGESGTGKELVARALHENSSRRDKPFIKVNCAAIPKDLMESELFGHERGAFTGAVGSKPGRFELASGGTLFLDEIGSIPVEMQVKLLRALQESEFERVGGVKTIRVDVRLVAATNSDLKREIAAGAFREDLYYRLNVVPIRLPSLRERATDIPLLVKHFIDKFNARLKKNVSGVEGDTEAHLVSYPWPGNIRELENVIERAVLFSDGSELKVLDLPSEVRDVSTPEPPQAQPASEALVSAATVDGLKEQVKAAMSRL
ncbi:MAG TPA: sigma-54 dependent transcriptional regulator, partial [Polyangiaceae bacterium]|nr:sigma-54 dependent transcriptional regulator [Polyangiaceae bacterium]